MVAGKMPFSNFGARCCRLVLAIGLGWRCCLAELLELTVPKGLTRMGFVPSGVPAHTIYVNEVQPSSWAADNGVRMNDEVVSLGGKKLNDMDLSTFTDLMQTRPLQAIFRRPDLTNPDVDMFRRLRISAAREDKTPDAPPLFIEGLMKHAPEHMLKPAYIATDDRLIKQCKSMQDGFDKQFGTERASWRETLYHPQAQQRVEGIRGKLQRPLSVFLLEDAFATFDGITFDSKYFYVWETPVMNGTFSEVVNKQGMTAILYAYQELGLFNQSTPGGQGLFTQGIGFSLRNATGAALFRAFTALEKKEQETRLKAGFLIAALGSSSALYKNTDCGTTEVVQHEECVVVVQQAFAVNFAHFMESVLPKLVHIVSDKKLSGAFKDFQCKVVLHKNFFTESYAKILQIPDEQIIWYNPCHVYHGKKVLVFNPLPRDMFLREEAQVVRHHFHTVLPLIDPPEPRALIFDARTVSKDSVAEPTRLVLSSGKAFEVTNVKELRALVKRAAGLAGTEFVEYVDYQSWPLTKTINLYRRAEEVVLLHGAGVMNLIHSPPCVRFVVVTPEGFPHMQQGCGISHARYVAGIRDYPYISVVVKGNYLEPVSVSVKHVRKAMAKLRKSTEYGCPALPVVDKRKADAAAVADGSKDEL